MNTEDLKFRAEVVDTLSATWWFRDDHEPEGVYFDSESARDVFVEFVNSRPGDDAVLLAAQEAGRSYRAQIDALRTLAANQRAALTYSEDQPPGVHRAPSGELLAKGKDIPSGWERSSVYWTSGLWFATPDVDDVGAPNDWYEVRPTPDATQDETVRVPWYEAMGRFVWDASDREAGWHEVRLVLLEDDYPNGAVGVNGFDLVSADADGMVGVRAEDL